ncbi:nitroreductase family protein [uncultured Limosilactobacillus sp.]|uniref:nitroreductase family protein n=1 Tax=uncultured Limosilactobacillus sp. TaxID=2837629 RepID=UPI0025D6BC66|nr:nitroreductase family protein [uncultured Limosilactobacillus sp.]
MELTEAIWTRQSVRDYTEQPVSRDKLSTIVHAGQAGAAGRGNYGVYHFTVISNPQVTAQLANTYHAPAVIVISVRRDQLRASKYLSAGTMVENMALAAENMGVGACMNMAALPSLPAGILPANQTPLICLTLGHTKQPLRRRQLPQDRVPTDYVD